MNVAVFFQKNQNKRWCALLKNCYYKFFLRSNAARIRYLRDSGAKIGNGCGIKSLEILGSEPYLVEIGNNTYFAGSDIKIFTHDGGVAHLAHMGITPKQYDCFGKVKIGSNCFIGHGAFILKHVTIGDNCVIGAGSVVTKSIPSGSVVAGVPAKVICTIEEYYEKNKVYIDDTIGWDAYTKRKYIESNMDKYEKLRQQREAL